MELDVQTADAIDLNACLRAIAGAFSSAPFWVEIKRTLTPAFYAWKYHCPAGGAVVVAAKDGGQIVSMLAAVPFNYTESGEEKKAWQIGDIVTLPEFRGRGLFRRCLQTLIGALPRGDLIICFPNRNSSHELLKQSFTRISELTTFVRPIVFWGGVEPPNYDVSLLRPSLDAPDGADLRMSKSFDYILWRYIRHPVHKYFVWADQGPGRARALVAARRFDLGRLAVGVIMEFLGGDSDAQRRLAHIAARWAAENRLSALLMSSNGLGPWTAMRLGFLPLPAALTPKRHVVVGRLAGEPGTLPPSLRRQWRFELGDWDGL